MLSLRSKFIGLSAGLTSISLVGLAQAEDLKTPEQSMLPAQPCVGLTFSKLVCDEGTKTILAEFNSCFQQVAISLLQNPQTGQTVTIIESYTEIGQYFLDKEGIKKEAEVIIESPRPVTTSPEHDLIELAKAAKEMKEAKEDGFCPVPPAF